jgi:hypothetical protein
MAIVAPWLNPPDYIRAMQSGAGLGLQIRSQRAQEEQQAAAQALQQQSLFQQQQRQQAEMQQQAQEAQMRQQNAAASLMQQAQEAQIRRENSMDALRLQQGFHQDTLAEQARDNARADAAAQLQGKRFDRQLATDERNAAWREGAAARAGAWKVNQANNFVKEVEDSLPEGMEMTEQDKSNLRSKFIGGGVNAINAPTKIVDAVNVEADNIRQISSVADRIKKFNSDYGEKAFDKFVGPIEGRATKLQAQFIPTEKREQATSDAKQIFAQVENMAQAFRKVNFGTALTAPEIQAFQGILSNPTFADYTDSIDNFGNILRQRVSEQIQDYKFAPNIPPRIKSQFMTQTIKKAPTAGGKEDLRTKYKY